MKRVLIFISIVTVFLVVFACTLPKEIEIKGNPSVRFAANMDLSEMFLDMLTDGFSADDELFIQNCTNPALETQTFLLGKRIIDEPFEIDELDPNLSHLGGFEYELTDPMQLSEPDASFPVDFSDIGEFIPGFQFTDSVKAYVFIECDSLEILNITTIELTFGSELMEIQGKDIDPRLSGIDLESSEYTAATIPKWGIDVSSQIIKLMNDGEETEVGVNIFIPAGEVIHDDWFGPINVGGELIIWLPLELVAGPDGAEILFPEDFMGDSGKDLFGRSNADDDAYTQMFESMRIKIDLSKSPFKGGTLLVESYAGKKVISISAELQGDSLDFPIDEEDMKKINDPEYFPFIPEFSVSFKPGGILSVPVDLMATIVSFEGKMKYTYVFEEN